MKDKEKEHLRKTLRSCRMACATMASALRLLQNPIFKFTPGNEKFMASYPKNLETLKKMASKERMLARRARQAGIHVSRWAGRDYVEKVLSSAEKQG
jgi:hypothetical protein